MFGSSRRKGAGVPQPSEQPPCGGAARGQDALGLDAVSLDGVTRVYGRGGGVVHALRGISVSFPSGSFTAVMGPSGSGKSTLLQCAAGLDRPSTGSVRLAGAVIDEMSEDTLTRMRRSRVGFVFQSFNLLGSLTVRQNVVLPLRLSGRRPDHRAADRLLAEVGLDGYGRRRPSELSGGQQQRVAIARALVTRPDVVFADEPTGALDSRTAAEVLGLLRQAATGMGATVVMVTHDPVAASYADRVLFLADGALAGALDRPTPDAVAARLVELESGSVPGLVGRPA